MKATWGSTTRWAGGVVAGLAGVALLAFLAYQILYTAPRAIDAASFISQAQGARTYCLLTHHDNGQAGTAQIHLTYNDGTQHTLQATLAAEGHSWLLAPNWHVTQLREVNTGATCSQEKTLAVSEDSAAQSLLDWLGLPTGPGIPALTR